jgi:hypothetical protein
MLKVATWNVLLEEDEYNLQWGNPLSIAFCGGGNQSACLFARWRRIWDQLESLPDDNNNNDVALLQEVQDGFLQLQSPLSNWTVWHRMGECAILGRRNDVVNLTVHAKYEVNVPGLSGCPAVPMVVMSSAADKDNTQIHLGSLHVAASIPNLTEWLDTVALPSFRTGTNNATRIILGGDFNHNLTDVPAIMGQEQGWSVVRSSSNNPLEGTSQKEDNWMGNFDGFLVYGMEAQRDPSVLLQGFMPKVVQGYPQHGDVIQEVGQFQWEEQTSKLLFSAKSSIRNLATVKEIPKSHPVKEALSDHLLVTATFFYERTNNSKLDFDVAPNHPRQQLNTTAVHASISVMLLVGMGTLFWRQWRQPHRQGSMFSTVPTTEMMESEEEEE